jgi:hypothetical protein
MRRIAMKIGLVLALMAFALPAQTQGNMTVVYKPVNVRHLNGVVTYSGSREGIMGAIVEDCDPMYKHILASTTTDRSGRFSFPHVKYGSVHYLNVRYPGWDLTRIPVTIRLFAKPELHKYLVIAN